MSGGERDPTRTFAPLAADYATGRPGYPAGLVAEIEARAPDRLDLVIDLAAGTGAAAEAILDGGGRVVALEPALPMLVEAVARLGGRDGWVGGVAGRAERLPLAAGVARVVVVAQAFHWLDAEAALEEIARVLAPGGVLLVVWNLVEEDAFVGGVRDLLDRREASGGRPVTERMRLVPEALAVHPAFEPEPLVEIDHQREMTADRYVTYARSWSYAGGALSPSQWDGFERDLRALIAERHGDDPWTERLTAMAHFARLRAPR